MSAYYTGNINNMDYFYNGAHEVHFYCPEARVVGKPIVENGDPIPLITRKAGPSEGTGYGRYSRHSWSDWKLIPSSQHTISRPAVATKFVEIPGRSGSLDLTTYLTGYQEYKDRTGTLEFIATVPSRIPIIESFFQENEYLEMELDDDPNHYYRGHFELNQVQHGKDYPTIQIGYQLEPFKYLNMVKSPRETNLVNPTFLNTITFSVSQQDAGIDDINYTPESPAEETLTGGTIAHYTGIRTNWGGKLYWDEGGTEIFFNLRSDHFYGKLYRPEVDSYSSIQYIKYFPAPVIRVYNREKGAKTNVYYAGELRSQVYREFTHVHTSNDNSTFVDYDLGVIQPMRHVFIGGRATKVIIFARGATI